MESGYCWQHIYDHLEEAGYDVRLAHLLKVKAIAEAKIMTDEIDSETLAHLLRADLLPESYVPPKEIRDLRELVKRRAFLVGMRTRLKNKVHAELAARACCTRVQKPLNLRNTIVNPTCDSNLLYKITWSQSTELVDPLYQVVSVTSIL